MTPEPLTLTARTPDAARRCLRLLTVNSLARAVLTDDRAPAPLTAAQPAPNRTPGSGAGGVTTTDYLQAYWTWRDVTQALIDLERGDGHLADPIRHQRLLLTRSHAEVNLKQTETDLRANLRPTLRPGHQTAYRVAVPAVTYAHPQYGPHLESRAFSLTVDTASLEGPDLAAFLSFMRETQDRARVGQWILYAPDTANGLQPTRKADATHISLRRSLEALILPVKEKLDAMIQGLPHIDSNPVALSV